jgi:hypothetical protein
MIRTTPDKVYIKRTIRGLYHMSQATPKGMLLDAAWDRSVHIYPGMCAMKTTGDNVTLLNGTGVPYGLFGVYIGGDGIDEILNSGSNACPVWVMAPDAEFEILAPAFDTAQTWTDPGDGTIVLVHASTTGANRGKLVPAGAANASTRPVGRLLKVVSSSKIVVGGLTGTV